MHGYILNNCSAVSFLIVSSQLQISVEGLPQQVEAGAIKKSSYFEREVATSEVNTKIDKDENEVKNLFSKLIMLYLDIR